MPKVTIEFTTEELALAQKTLGFVQSCASGDTAEPVQQEVNDAPAPKPQVSAETATVADTSTRSKASPADAQKATEEQSETSTKPKRTRKSTKPTFEDLRAATKAAKEEHGTEFCEKAITSIDGVEKASTLLKTIGNVEKADYADAITKLKAGPVFEEVDETETKDSTSLFDDAVEEEFEADDGFGEEEPTKEEMAEELPELDAAVVESSLRGYAKVNGRQKGVAILHSVGATSITEVRDMSQEKLYAITKAVS